MSSGLNLPRPDALPFERWAALLAEALARYNVPSPVSEGLWLSWALQVFSIPQVQKLGFVDPRMFPTWQAWATSTLQVSN